MASEWTKRQKQAQEKLFEQSRRILEEIEVLKEKAKKLLKRQADFMQKGKARPK